MGGPPHRRVEIASPFSNNPSMPTPQVRSPTSFDEQRFRCLSRSPKARAAPQPVTRFYGRAARSRPFEIDEVLNALELILDDAAVATANLRSDDLKTESKTFDPLINSLTTIAKRASAIDEEVIRQFLQREGVKIFVGGRRDALKALE